MNAAPDRMTARKATTDSAERGRDDRHHVTDANAAINQLVTQEG